MATVTTTYVGDMLFETQLGSHTITIDVPAPMGGSDRAPTPPEYFVASLGSCVAAFVANYCRQHDIDSTGLAVDVSFDKVENPTRLTDIKVTVKLPRADCGKRRGALMRVAEHCPVHETIEMAEVISFELQEGVIEG